MTRLRFREVFAQVLKIHLMFEIAIKIGCRFLMVIKLASSYSQTIRPVHSQVQVTDLWTAWRRWLRRKSGLVFQVKHDCFRLSPASSVPFTKMGNTFTAIHLCYQSGSSDELYFRVQFIN